MRARVWIGAIALMVGGGGPSALVACGDDDHTGVTLPDAATADVNQTPLPDSGNPTDTGTPDSTAPAAPILPQTVTRIPNAIDPYGIVYATDGLLYVSGATIEGADRKLAVWRFDATTGALDTTFGTQGVVTVDVPGSEASFDMVEVSAGNFVVHAVAGGKVYLTKLTDNGGTFTFGTPTVVPFAWGDGDLTQWLAADAGAAPPRYLSWGIALDKSVAATPKIVVFAYGAPARADAGVQRMDDDRWVARVMADTLLPDPAFNGGEAVSFDADRQGRGDNGRRGLVFSDGSIVFSGYTNFGTGNNIVLIRLLPNGAPDPAFGFGTSTPGLTGQARYNPVSSTSGEAEAYGIGRQSTGRFVTTGYGNTHFNVQSKSADIVISGVKPDGLDPTFGKLGAMAIQSETDPAAGLGLTPFRDRGRDLAVLPDDRTVHAGVYDEYAAIYVFDKNGQPDKSSGVNGVIEYAYPGNFFRVVVSPDGKRLAATTQSLNQNADASAPVGSVLATFKVGP